MPNLGDAQATTEDDDRVGSSHDQVPRCGLIGEPIGDGAVDRGARRPRPLPPQSLALEQHSGLVKSERVQQPPRDRALRHHLAILLDPVSRTRAPNDCAEVADLRAFSGFHNLLATTRWVLLKAMARRKDRKLEGASSADDAPKRGRRRKKDPAPLITVRHMLRRDIGRVWDFLKVSFREVNTETVEYQRPRSKHRFEEVFEEEGIEQLVFEVDGDIVAYAEASYEVTGSDNWINPRYFEKRDMKPLFVDELAVHPEWNGRGVGSFAMEQLHHLARVHGLNHLVLEVAENNERALAFYKKRDFRKLDAAIFMACDVDLEPELLPPRKLPPGREPRGTSDDGDETAS